MPLPPVSYARTRIHEREIVIEGYRRDDGMWDIEGHLVDRKDKDYPLATGMRPARQPVHEMSVRITIDSMLVIRDIVAVSDAVPYAGHCEQITPAYKKLIGVRIEAGFRMRVLQMIGGNLGCTHLTEIVCVIASGAIQTLAGQLPDWNKPDQRPFQINGCHALVETSEAVRLYYPIWYRPRQDSGGGRA